MGFGLICPFQKEFAEVYINVNHLEKDEAKKLKFRWDRTEQSWYYPCYLHVDNERHNLSVQKDIYEIASKFEITKISSTYCFLVLFDKIGK
jgi:hypothetical protein